MIFDWTVTLGNVLSTMAALLGIGATYLAQRERLARMELKINTVWRWWLKSQRLNGDENTE